MSSAIVDAGSEGAITATRVHQVDAMKSTQTGLTEGALNGVRYIAKHDPQNVIFAIDNRTQAGEVNEIRLQPTLRKLGTDVMPADDDDAGKFLIKMRRMLIYFLGSYSSGAFAQKMCELGINDELEEHGTDNSVEDLKSRMKTSRAGSSSTSAGRRRSSATPTAKLLADRSRKNGSTAHSTNRKSPARTVPNNPRRYCRTARKNPKGFSSSCRRT
jgi:phage terminase large subunit GpA-like protein